MSKAGKHAEAAVGGSQQMVFAFSPRIGRGLCNLYPPAFGQVVLLMPVQQGRTNKSRSQLVGVACLAAHPKPACLQGLSKSNRSQQPLIPEWWPLS